MKKDSRSIALLVINEVCRSSGTLDEVMDDILEMHPLPRRDRSLLNALVFGVLRWRGKLDYIIRQYSNRNIHKIDSTVLNILRLGAFQILWLSKIPDAAAVHSAVEMAKSSNAPWAGSFVNAVLRRLVRESSQLEYPDKDKNPVRALCVEKSMPEWLIKRWIARYGIHETEALCDEINKIPPITIRINTLKADPAELKHSLSNEVERLENAGTVKDAVYLYRPKKPISEINSFINGWFQVQDEAAQLTTQFLNPKTGEKILDACAGLGGKTGHIAQFMQNQGNIIALDSDGQKLNKLAKEMQRLGITNVQTLEMDLQKSIDNIRIGEFDRILLDAPCSGLGVLQRNPDAKWKISKQNFEYYKKKQKILLDQVSTLLKPSGVLVYAVCSMEPEENDEVVKEFLNSHSDFAIDKNTGQLDGNAGSFVDENGFFRTFPHKHHMAGFFAVRLRRNGE